MEKSDILEIYLSQFLEFVSDVQRVFPEDFDIKVLKNFLNVYASLNGKHIIDIWKKSVTDLYRKEIDARDFDFFIDKDWTNDLSNTDNQSLIIGKINELKSRIRSMDDDNKTKVVRYIENLTKLCDLYHE